MDSLTFSTTIEIKAKSKLEATIIKKHLSDMANNLTVESLAILAEKSQKKGMDEKIKQFKNLI